VLVEAREEVLVEAREDVVDEAREDVQGKAREDVLDKARNKTEEEGRGINLVAELLDEVVTAVVGAKWMEGLEEVKELMALVNLPLTDNLEDLKNNCKICDKVFGSQRLLYFHHRMQHKDPGNCRICDKYFSSNVKLNCHIEKVHKYGPEIQPKVHICEICGRIFNNKSNLNRHLKIHSDIVKKIIPKQKSFPCNRCHKSYSQQWILKKHIKSRICRKNFRRIHNLPQHVKISNKSLKKVQSPSSSSSRNLKPTDFPCPVCHKKFPVKKMMREHKYRVHSSEKYRCTACDKTFKRKSNLARHVKRHSNPGRIKKPLEALSRKQQLNRVKSIVDKFSMDTRDFSVEDKRTIFKQLVKDNPEILNTYASNPLSEEDVIEMVRDGNLSDRQVLKILVILRRRWGKKAITANIQKLLKQRKELLSHLFTAELLAAEDELHFVDKDGQPITRYLVYCTDLLALTEAKEVLEEDEYENVIGIDDGKDLLKVHVSEMW
jgi:KRAB domain-containing zinc finger protein